MSSGRDNKWWLIGFLLVLGLLFIVSNAIDAHRVHFCDAWPWKARAGLKMALGRLDQAKKDFERCLELNSELGDLLEETLKALGHPLK